MTSNDGTAQLWLADLHDTIHAICALRTRDLISEERIQFSISDQGPPCFAAMKENFPATSRSNSSSAVLNHVSL